MVFRIVIAGESQCHQFAEICLLAEYLEQKLPAFCYERIQKPVIDWKTWLTNINKENEWNHIVSPLIWKELLLGGSKPIYIGSAQDFLEYCYSYYNFDVFLAPEKFKTLPQNIIQYEKKHKNIEAQKLELNYRNKKFDQNEDKFYSVCISGATSNLTMYLICGLMELCTGTKYISTIYIFDHECPSSFMKLAERECGCISKNNVGKIVKSVDKIGNALTNSDLLIILDHIPFRSDMAIGTWLNKNKKLIENIAVTINVCASPNLRVIFPNLGPACYNATILADKANYIEPDNIVVATTDLGMDIASILSEIADVPVRNMYCPPVWGFVGINHLIDVKSTIHRYDTFMPNKRYTKVKKSTLCIGTITPEIRTMDYLINVDETLWKKYTDKKISSSKKNVAINKTIAVINVIKMWLIDIKTDYITNLGILCDGSFGLSLNGFFSQPAHLVNGKWKPAHTYILPKDSQMNINYLLDIAKLAITMRDGELPQIYPYTPCTCKPIIAKSNWFL